MKQTAQKDVYPTLKEVLALPAFAGSRVLGGEKGLETLVLGVNLTDTPDYDSWVSAGELMLTTCFAIADDETAISQFIIRLAEHGLSGACVKPARYLGGRMPEVMISEAKRLKFPLIELTSEVRFADLTKAVSDEILRRKTALLEASLSVNRMLTNNIAEGANLQDIVEMTAELTNCSVMILDRINDRTAIALSDRMKGMYSGEKPEILKELLMTDAEETDISVEGHSFGTMYLQYQEEWCGLDRELMNQILQALPLEISRERSVREGEKRHLINYFLHLISDTVIDEAWENERAAAYGLKPGAEHLLIRLRLEALGNHKNEMFHRTILAQDIQMISREMKVQPYMMRLQEDVVILLEDISGNGLQEKENELYIEAKQLIDRSEFFSIRAGASSICSGIYGIRQGNLEAKTALTAAIAKHRPWMTFNDLGVLRLVYASQPEREVKSFLQDTLKTLYDKKDPKKAELVHTLYCYFELAGNQRQMAEQLFIHYNTAAYRLKQIQEMTGKNLQKREDRLQLHMAVELYYFQYV